MNAFLMAVAVAALAAPALAGEASQACVEKTTVEQAVTKHFSDGHAAQRDPENRFADYLVFHGQCRALSGEGEKACDAIKTPVSGPEGDLASKCRQQVRETEFIRAIVNNDPKRESKCSLQMKLLKWEFKPGVKEGDLCKIFLETWDHPDQLTDRVSKLLVTPIQGKKQWDVFVARKGGTMGIKKYCSAQPAFDEQQLCSEYASYRAAHAAKDASACGEHGICRQMVSSSPEACGVYARRLKEIACRAPAKGQVAQKGR